MCLPRRQPFKGMVVEQKGSCQDISDRWPSEIQLKQRLPANAACNATSRFKPAKPTPGATPPCHKPPD